MLSLQQTISQNSTLTADQRKAIEALEAFLQSNTSCFILKGYAGTGKTFLLKGVANYLMEQHFHVKLLAPTGRAARILQQKTGFKAATIHKGIYNFSELDEVETHVGGKKKGFVA